MSERAVRRMAEAMGARDFATMAELIAPDAVLRSPITGAVEVRGRERIVGLLQVVRDAYERLDYTDLLASGDVGVQAFRTRVDGMEMEGLDLMRFDDDDRVREFTIFFRPLPGLATLTHALATRIVARRSPGAARMVGAAMRPLLAMTRAGERATPTLMRRAGLT